jgi:osmotically-inducible protein OsmY
MRHALSLKSIFVALALTMSLVACSAISGRETAGEYVDDSTLTAKVKSAIYQDPALKVMEIGVETMQNVVQLSGFVDSTESKDRAGEVARDVSGVKDVTNDLVVRCRRTGHVMSIIRTIGAVP